MKAFFASIFLLLLAVSFSFSQGNNHILEDKEITTIVKQTLDHTYNFEFSEAQKLNEAIRKKYPSHPAYDFLMALNVYWEMYYNDSFKEKSPVFVKHLSNALALSKKMLEKDEKDIEGVFFKLSSEAYTALYYAEKNEMSSAVGYARRAYTSLKVGFELRNKLNEFYFPTGLYNYFVVQYPENHPGFKPFMFLFMNGNKAKGLQEMDYVYRNGVFTKYECTYHLCNIYLKYENKPLVAYEYTKTLSDKYPDNIFFTVRHIETLIAREEYKEAEKYALVLYKSGKKFFIGISYVFYGILNEKYYKDYETSRKYFNQAITAFKESNNPDDDYLSFAYAGLGRHYHQAGNKEKAIQYYKLCKEIADYTSIKIESEQYLEKYD